MSRPNLLRILLTAPVLLATVVGCVGDRAQSDASLGDLAGVVAHPVDPRPAVAPAPRIDVTWQSRLVDGDYLNWEPLEYSQPQVACGHLVVVGTSKGDLIAVDRFTGAPVWSIHTGTRIDGSPTATADHIFVGNDAGEVRAVTCGGSTEWVERVGGEIDGAIAVDEGVLYVQDSADTLIALDAVDGNRLWDYQRPVPDYFTLKGASAPTVHGDHVFAGFADGALVALNVEDGSVAWQTDLSHGEEKFMDVDGAPLVVGDSVYAASYSGGLFAVSRKDGVVQWRTDVTGASRVEAVDDLLYVTTSNRYAMAVDRTTGKVRWSVRHAEITPTAPTLTGDYLVYASTDHAVYIFDRNVGYPLLKFDPAGGFNAPVTMHGAEGFLFSNGGVMYRFVMRAL